MHKQKIIRVGNSLAVTLPSQIVKGLSLKAGDEVSTKQTDHDSVTYQFLNPQQLTLSQFQTTPKKKK